MAKRKRLTVPAAPNTSPAAPQAPSKGSDMQITARDVAPASGLPLGQVPPDRLSPARRAPIADVAGEASALSALEQVTSELHAARTEGRMIQALPLNAIQPNHLVRDRITLDSDEMEVLKTSLAARGQQTPIEVMDLGGGSYGLISGFRRLQALKELAQAPQAAQTVLAIVRRPEQASDAYTAMVEENEIRVGLSYFERASVVRAAVREGVFASEAAALQGLFASASRSKRSKIKSFLPLVEHLGAVLTYPTALTERLGLALSARCETDADFVTRLKDRLRKAHPEDAQAEQALLAKALDGGAAALTAPEGPAPAPKAQTRVAAGQAWSAQPRRDIAMSLSKGQLVLKGEGVTEALAQELAAVLAKAQN